jgi:hypothetical protein
VNCARLGWSNRRFQKWPNLRFVVGSPCAAWARRGSKPARRKWMNALVVVAPAGGLPCIPDCSHTTALCSAAASSGAGFQREPNQANIARKRGRMVGPPWSAPRTRW